MRLRHCDICGSEWYQAVLETDDGQTETVYSRTIPGLRELVFDRIHPNPSQYHRLDELFERLLDKEIAFTKQWLNNMNSRINRAAA